MPTELTFAILKYGYLILLWVFLWLVVRSLRRDIETFSPHKSLSRRRRDRKARKASKSPTPAAPSAGRSSAPTPRQSAQPTLLVVIDGPLAGSSVPLGNAPITLGRAASNTAALLKPGGVLLATLPGISQIRDETSPPVRDSAVATVHSRCRSRSNS